VVTCVHGKAVPQSSTFLGELVTWGEATVFGLEIGGSGVKGARGDLAFGTLADARFRIPPPHPATPAAVAEVVGEVVRHFDWTGPRTRLFGPAPGTGGLNRLGWDSRGTQRRSLPRGNAAHVW